MYVRTTLEMVLWSLTMVLTGVGLTIAITGIHEEITKQGGKK